MTDVLPTREGYDQWSAVYDVDGNPLVELEQPEVDRYLGDIRGLRIADVGCGTGRHAVRLARAGAEVTALDFSEGMIGRAKAKPGADRVRWIAHDLAQRLPLEDAIFDRVLCALVFDHVKDVGSLVGEMTRICAPGGRLVISVMHPAMMLKGVQARFIDPTTGQRQRVESVPNQISDYVRGALIENPMARQLKLIHMSEHAVDEALAERAPRAAPYVGWPLLLVLVFDRA